MIKTKLRVIPEIMIDGKYDITVAKEMNKFVQEVYDDFHLGNATLKVFNALPNVDKLMEGELFLVKLVDIVYLCSRIGQYIYKIELKV